MHTTQNRTCRDCGDSFETANNSTRCSRCANRRFQERHAKACACGATIDYRATVCRECRGSPNPAGRKRRSAVRLDNGCLVLPTHKGDRGYAKIGARLAHRVVWEEAHGPIPAEMTVDHECHNAAVARGDCAGGSTCAHRACIEVTHLALATAVDNWRQGAQRRRS